MIEFFRFIERFSVDIGDVRLAAITLLMLACSIFFYLEASEAWRVAMPLGLFSAWMLLSNRHPPKPPNKSTSSIRCRRDAAQDVSANTDEGPTEDPFTLAYLPDKTR